MKKNRLIVGLSLFSALTLTYAGLAHHESNMNLERAKAAEAKIKNIEETVYRNVNKSAHLVQVVRAQDSSFVAVTNKK